MLTCAIYIKIQNGEKPQTPFEKYNSKQNIHQEKLGKVNNFPMKEKTFQKGKYPPFFGSLYNIWFSAKQQ